MPFLTLDDGFPDHPKVDGLTDSAFRLHVSGLFYASKQLTDGHIPAHRVPRLVPRFRPRTAAELVERGLWVPTDDGYLIHDYLDWNRSRAQVETDREHKKAVRSAAGRKGAQARWHPTVVDGKSHSNGNGKLL